MADAAALPLPGRIAVAAAVAVGLWWSGKPGAAQGQCACAGEQATLVLDLLGRQLERCASCGLPPPADRYLRRIATSGGEGHVGARRLGRGRARPSRKELCC